MDTQTAAPRHLPRLHRILLRFALIGLAASPLASAAAAGGSPIFALGVIAHDQGPTSDHHEHGIDLNLEVQFAPLDFFGSPRPHLGATLNFRGDTSIAYAGLSFPLLARSNWFLNGSMGAAVHNGPLHKDPAGCRLYGDCGFGVRVMPLFSAELGYRLDDKSAISLFYAHMSHEGIIPGENEGLDYTGLRYLHSF